MKRIISFLVFFFLCCAFIPNAKALTIGIADVNSVLNVRSGTTTESDILFSLANNSVFEITNTITTESSGCDGETWYQIDYNGSNGYVCADYVRTSTTNYDYETELAKFPESYQTKIAYLHELYPYAIFVRQSINTSFSTVINAEYTSTGRSLIWDCYSSCSRDGLKSTDSWSYNYYTNKFESDFAGSYWYAANKTTIGYYLDPRNFLAASKMFMFLSLSYDSEEQTIEGLNYILKDTFMDNTQAGDSGKTYAEVFLEAAEQSSVNPYFLAARVIQEQGTSGGSALISGTYTGYEGYYNYFNINASGSTNTEVIVNGLTYAKSKGWDSVEKSIIGGAKFIASGYINVGQDNLYLQKWQVISIPNWSLYTHQYMQNIQAPSTESVKMYNTYWDAGLLNTTILVFEIPVYNDMPESTSLPNSGNPNNYLKTLTVDGAGVDSFDGANTNYTVHVAANATKVTIAATKVYSGSTATGLGDITLTTDEQEVSVVVTAQNGDVKTYKITVIKDKIPASIEAILNDLSYTNDGTNLLNMKSLTDTANLISAIVADNENATVSIYDKNNQLKTTGYMATGDLIYIVNGEDETALNIIVPGDINGDGVINSGDLYKMRQQLIGLVKLSDVYYMSADIANDDNIINSGDLYRLRLHLIGKREIGE